MELPELFQWPGIALGLGWVVGLQRERGSSRLVRLRTFLLTIFFVRVAILVGATALTFLRKARRPLAPCPRRVPAVGGVIRRPAQVGKKCDLSIQLRRSI
jgi:hypothetical protein